MRVLAILLCMMGAHATDTIVVVPEPSNTPLLNPGKGWILYGRPSNQSAETLSLGTVGYERFNWCDINPAEDTYNWTQIDEGITQWAQHGKRYAFGIMCASSHSKVPGGYVTPKWIFDAGAKFEHKDAMPYPGTELHGEQATENVLAVPDDPIYLAKLGKFLKAMGARYDGNPHIEFIDVRSYGNWGEGHIWPWNSPSLEPAQFKLHMQLHLDAFKQTQLMVSTAEDKYKPAWRPVYQWAVDHGIGLRRDGICGNSDGSDVARALGKEPAVFELHGTYESIKAQGWWDGTNENEGWGYPLADCTEIGKPSYIGMSAWGTAAQSFLKAERPLIERLANRMGYYFVLKRAEFPKTIKANTDTFIRFAWANKGVAPVYVPCAVGMALLNNDGYPVEVFWPSECNPASWAPDSTTDENAIVRFSNVPSGTYQLAVGLFRHIGDQFPAFRLGIQGGTQNGWYPLSRITLE